MDEHNEPRELLMLLVDADNEATWTAKLYGLQPGFYRIEIRETDGETAEVTKRGIDCVGPRQAVEAVVEEFECHHLDRQASVVLDVKESVQLPQMLVSMKGMRGDVARAVRQQIKLVASGMARTKRRNLNAWIEGAPGAL